MVFKVFNQTHAKIIELDILIYKYELQCVLIFIFIQADHNCLLMNAYCQLLVILRSLQSLDVTIRGGPGGWNHVPSVSIQLSPGSRDQRRLTS